jgi:selenide,water dikinase
VEDRVRGTGPAKELVLIGGGHAQVYVLDSFARRPMPEVRLTLIARDVLTPYSGMLPGFIAGHYTAAQCHIDLAPLAARAGARLVNDEASGLDLSGGRVLCREGPPVPYDVVSVDIGSTPDLRPVPGAERFATPIKPVSTLRTRWDAILARASRETGPQRFLTVGGGAAGVEVTLAMRHKLRTLAIEDGRDPGSYSFTVVTKGELLEDHNAGVRRRFRRVLEARGVAVVECDPVMLVEEGCAVCASGRRLGYDELIWVTQAGGAPWLAATGLELDRQGFIVVDATLRSVTDRRVFAAGDVAANREHPRPKAGVFAVRQGPPLAENLRRALAGSEPLPFTPQKEFLSLITTGDKSAVASRGSWSAEGRLVWWVKDQIDRRWMRQWQERAGSAEAS